VEVAPRDGGFLHDIEDIEATIKAHGATVALVLFSGVQYFTGQAYDVRVVHVHACMHVCVHVHACVCACVCVCAMTAAVCLPPFVRAAVCTTPFL
jgi:kynureninase